MILCSILAAVVHVFVIGDSLVDAAASKVPSRASWAESLRPRLAKGYEMVNLGVGGTSTRTYRQCAQWAEFQRLAGRGDWLVITLGRNDASGSTTRNTTVEQYRQNLKEFIGEGRRRGLRVVLVTPVGDGVFAADGRYLGHHQCRLHAAGMRALAKEENVPLVDLDLATVALWQKLGAQAARPNHMVSVDGKDTTHLTQAGAQTVAELFWRDAHAAGLPFIAD